MQRSCPHRIVSVPLWKASCLHICASISELCSFPLTHPLITAATLIFSLFYIYFHFSIFQRQWLTSGTVFWHLKIFPLSMPHTHTHTHTHSYCLEDNCCCSVTKAWLFCNPLLYRQLWLLCPWVFPGKNTGVGCHFLLQEIFPTQGLNPYSQIQVCVWL